MRSDRLAGLTNIMFSCVTNSIQNNVLFKINVNSLTPPHHSLLHSFHDSVMIQSQLFLILIILIINPTLNNNTVVLSSRRLVNSRWLFELY